MSGLAISLTTDQSSYTDGQTVKMTLIATNHSRHNITVLVGPNTNVSPSRERSNHLAIELGPPTTHADRATNSASRQVAHADSELDSDSGGNFPRAKPDGPQGTMATFSVAATQPAPTPPVNPPPVCAA